MVGQMSQKLFWTEISTIFLKIFEYHRPLVSYVFLFRVTRSQSLCHHALRNRPLHTLNRFSVFLWATQRQTQSHAHLHTTWVSHLPNVCLHSQKERENSAQKSQSRPVDWNLIVKSANISEQWGIYDAFMKIAIVSTF